jgi:hypothetical protein
VSDVPRFRLTLDESNLAERIHEETATGTGGADEVTLREQDLTLFIRDGNALASEDGREASGLRAGLHGCFLEG